MIFLHNILIIIKSSFTKKKNELKFDLYVYRGTFYNVLNMSGNSSKKKCPKSKNIKEFKSLYIIKQITKKKYRDANFLYRE
jgi:hypothetical protein